MNQTDRIYDLSMIWSKVNDIFPYFERLTFDWNDLYLRYIPQILAAEDEQTFHDLLTSFVDSLQDGHTKYIPPAEYRRSKPYVPPAAPSFAVSADGVFTVKINDFMHDYAGTVREYLEKYPEITKICIDVRDNVGGNTIYGAKIAELFIPGEFHACQKWTRIQKGIDAAVASQTANMSEATIKRYLAEGLMTEEGVQKDAKIRTGTYYETYIDSFGAPEIKPCFRARWSFSPPVGPSLPQRILSPCSKAIAERRSSANQPLAPPALPACSNCAAAAERRWFQWAIACWMAPSLLTWAFSRTSARSASRKRRNKPKALPPHSKNIEENCRSPFNEHASRTGKNALRRRFSIRGAL